MFSFQCPLLAVLLLGALAGGCSGPYVPPLDKPLARQSLQQALDAWKGGGQQTALAGWDPPIIMNDPDWREGRTLTEYQLTSPDSDDGINLHGEVMLAIADRSGRVTRRTVTYIVGTSPQITIFRD